MASVSGEVKLNKRQLEAVTHGDGPLLIVAGAGTGKTTVVTERIKWLITKKKINPGEILALTFTDKAAREMEERVDRALPYGVTQMWISTFHSFGDRILRQEAIHIGLDPGYRLMTQAETVVFFRKHLFAFDLEYFRPLGNPTKFVTGILSHFERLKDEDVTPQNYLTYANNFEEKFKVQSSKLKVEKDEIDKTWELARTYEKYEELKTKNGMMDFGDLITNTLKLFRQRKNVLKQYQEQFKYILIDEFQDTNFAQNELAILISGERKNISVVGDDDQAIYRWRGAAISNIIQFRQRFPKAKIVVLKDNYRSTSSILEASYKLIQNNNPDRLEIKEKINKKLYAARKLSGEKVEFIYSNRVEGEADEAVKKIKYQKSNIKDENGQEKYKWSDFAILVRANNHADPFVRALARAGIPYQFLGPGMLFRQSEVKDLIAYLTLLDNLEDSVAVFRVLSMPIFDLSERDIAAVISFSKRLGLSLFEGLDVLTAIITGDKTHWSISANYQTYLPQLTQKTKETTGKFIKMVSRHLKLAKSETAGQVLFYFLQDTGLLESFTRYSSVKEEKAAQNISKFFDKLKSFEAAHEDASISAVMDWITMSLELGESPLASDIDWVQNDAVNILTIHSSKGLEFPVVFLVNLVGQRFPTTERREKIPIPLKLIKEILPEGDYHLQEERRLCYVGMTRARDFLYFTAANYYAEGKRERKLSPFIAEALGVNTIKNQSANWRTNPQNGGPINQLALLEWRKEAQPEATPVRQQVEYLSYSQIETFLTCPLQYKYRYVLRIPVPTSAAASFGSSMHLSLQKFYELVRKGEKPGKEDLLKLLDQVWLPLGYGTRKYEEKMKERGRKMLSSYYEKGHNPHVNVQNLEQLFRLKIGPRLKIGGKIDRVDITKEGKLEIIDYKTGRRPTEKEIKENLQMTVYALAAKDPGIYNKPPKQVILSFYFFDAQEKVSCRRTDEQLLKAKEKLMVIAQDISKSTFGPKVGRWCDFCDFRLICEAWQ